MLHHQTQCAFKRTFFVVSPNEIATCCYRPILLLLPSYSTSAQSPLVCYTRCKLIEFSHLCIHLCLNRLDLDCIAVLITVPITYLPTQCYGSSNGDRTSGHIQWNTTSRGKTIHMLQIASWDQNEGRGCFSGLSSSLVQQSSPVNSDSPALLSCSLTSLICKLSKYVVTVLDLFTHFSHSKVVCFQ